MAMSVAYTNFCGMITHENRGGTERAYMPDLLGSTAALLDSSQNQTDTWDYWPYGEVAARTGTNGTPFTYCGIWGYFKDILDRLLYVRARHYYPAVCAWILVDPLWPQEYPYNYVTSSPTSSVDPLGLQGRRWCDIPRNPCSELSPNAWGGWVAGLCSMDTVYRMIKALLDALKIKDIPGWIKALLKGLKDQPRFSPEDCCKRAANWQSPSGKPGIPELIGWLCSIIKDNSVKDAACSDMARNYSECEACCERMYLSGTNQDQKHYEICKDKWCVTKFPGSTVYLV